MSADLERRFGGVARLYGQDGAVALRNAHVCVVGIGGVGSWAAEALARTAVGRLTLIDLDMVAESNTNRQIHALGAINPACEIRCIEDFVTPDNVTTMLDGDFTAVIDAIDQVRAKVAMIAFCQRRKLPIVIAGAAGGQIDPTQIRVSDLSQTVQDPLLAKVRSTLRRDHGFPRDPRKKFGVSAVYSTEPLRYPKTDAACDAERGPAGLNCAGFGSSVCVTSVFGMAAAAQVINLISQA
jgi:tRNA A37 threonylcarbamoyladenosine dehydratase